MRSVIGFCLLLTCLLFISPVYAQITIDVSQPLTPLTNGLGINTNFLMDDDATHLPVDRTQTSALSNAGMKYWRFPEGELADVYRWWPSAAPTLLRTGPNEWPANDRTYTLPDNATLLNTLTFDEFMAQARQVGATPVITIAYDSMYKPATEGGTVPTRAQLLKLAVDWVWYANVVKGYRIKYWEIGNESYNQSWIGGTNEQVYAADLVAFSQAMKAIDPTIRIGANVTEKGTWLKTVLCTASSSIDWLSLHVYPVYAWGSFDWYRANNPQLMDSVNRTLPILDTYATPTDRARITLAVTEFAPLDWSATNTWANVNDLGHALMTFDLAGALELHPRVLFSQYWVTRWHGDWGLNALTSTNKLTPIGQALAIWGQTLGHKLNVVYQDTSIRVWLTEQANGTRVLLLRNVGTSAEVITLQRLPAGTMASAVFTGSGPSDLTPSYGPGAPVVGGKLTIPPYSITVVTINK